LSPVEIALLSKDKPLEFQPGEKMNYNNTGYVLLGHIIEKVSGQKYDEYLKSNIFEPLGMDASGYDFTEQIIPKRVSGYSWTAKGYANSTFLDMSLPHAAGSLYSSVGDLYKWDRALYGEKILSSAMKQKMFTPGMNDYAYGWSVTKQHNRQVVSHGGGIFGFNTMIQRFPEDDAVVIVLSNVENANAGKIADSLASVLFGETTDLPWERKSISLSKGVLDRYAGRYKLPPFVLTVTQEEGRLMVQPDGQPKLQAHAESERRFFLKEVDAILEFTGDGGRPSAAVILRQGSRALEGQRIVD
jgi:CubicO group peptidase (beta-lactamase class C family)